jgi:hypothetical protein
VASEIGSRPPFFLSLIYLCLPVTWIFPHRCVPSCGHEANSSTRGLVRFSPPRSFLARLPRGAAPWPGVVRSVVVVTASA